MESRLLILNADPVFQDRVLSILEEIGASEQRIVRTMPEAISVLLAEHFDGFVVEGDAALALEQATSARQHFPSLPISCVAEGTGSSDQTAAASQQKIRWIGRTWSTRRLHSHLASFVNSLANGSGEASEGIDPCHSLIGNLNQFSAAEILQMSCLGQRSGRFTFKSGRGSSEIYLQHGSLRHAVFGTLEGEMAIAEVFRWRQGRFYFEEGIISQVQTVDRPWAHLLIDNLQKLDETLELSSGQSS
ncbi:MAG TPA: DUF4388 domain-containing protein [Chthoniobacterales bacterium]|nr:DUF4388 domain-containing protein [Chthoniobacterales bacterium]